MTDNRCSCPMNCQLHQPFTDDDLKQLKNLFRGRLFEEKGGYVSNDQFIALLARLEASEAYGIKMCKKFPSWFLKELYAWQDSTGYQRKAAGK